jgi:hypothetical protein
MSGISFGQRTNWVGQVGTIELIFLYISIQESQNKAHAYIGQGYTIT